MYEVLQEADNLLLFLVLQRNSRNHLSLFSSAMLVQQLMISCQHIGHLVRFAPRDQQAEQVQYLRIRVREGGSDGLDLLSKGDFCVVEERPQLPCFKSFADSAQAAFPLFRVTSVYSDFESCLRISFGKNFSRHLLPIDSEDCCLHSAHRQSIGYVHPGPRSVR